MDAAIYRLGGRTAPQAEASPEQMGFKAWNLLRMANLGLPVPPAIVLGTPYCTQPALRDRAGVPTTWAESLSWLEQQTGLRLGDPLRPLLLSVRSGAPVSMPGMMETLLNIGLNDDTARGLLRQTGHPRLVWDAYRRLVAGFGEIVAGIDGEAFERDARDLAGGRDERELDFAELRTLTRRHLTLYQELAREPFPQVATEQLARAIRAVLDSWNAPKARTYRELNHLDDAMGTAVTLQAMVFGDAGGRSGAGVGFTRDPATGEPALWVDFLFNAQGEDVVSGRRSAHGHDSLAAVLPQAWDALRSATATLERAFGDMQDFEFTVQEGQLYLLQTRHGKRTPRAAARIALDLMDEGVISPDAARDRTQALRAEDLAVPTVVSADGAPLQALATAASACSGVAIGEIALTQARAQQRHAAGAAVILVRRDAETSDLAALECAQGLLTQRGARTSHAAVVARQLGKVCLVGCDALSLDEANGQIGLGGQTFREGDTLTLDGNTGAIYAGRACTAIEPGTELWARVRALQPATDDAT